MNEQLTKTEKEVIFTLQQMKVATKKEICKKFNISHMTFVRALKKYGYYNSYNKNSSYYTLFNIPKFNKYGIWLYNGIGFSGYSTLDKTLISLIDKSPSGYTVTKINKILGTATANILSRICNQNLISKYLIGHRAVYLTIEAPLQEKQRTNIEEQLQQKATLKHYAKSSQHELPVGLDATEVISILVQLIAKPKSSASSISRKLQAAGVNITASHVKEVISFYSLEKKTVQ